MSKWNYFTESEVMGLDTEFVAKLDKARHEAGVPFIITSGKRTPADNERVLGVEGSSHVKGLGVDVRCHDSHTRFKIIKGLILAEFVRFGIYDKHIHIDFDQGEDKPQEVAWLGKSS